MLKILSITLGGKEVPSSNFRFRCYYPYCKEIGFSVKEINTRQVFIPSLPKIPKIQGVVNVLGLKDFFVRKNLMAFEKEVREADVIWVNKILKSDLLQIVKKYSKFVIFDIDDAIWIGSEEEVKENLAIADTIIVGNEYLAEEIRKRSSANIEIIPTTIELNHYPSVKREEEDQPFRIGWLGSSYTNEYIAEIAPALNSFLEKNKAELYIISSKMENLKSIFPQKTIFTEWSEETYIQEISRFDVGIMPMPDTEWVKGKCSFKMLQYMGACVPVVVSPYGMNADVLAEGNCGIGAKSIEEWQIALQNLYERREKALEMGRIGREIVEQKYATAQNFKLLSKIFEAKKELS